MFWSGVINVNNWRNKEHNVKQRTTNVSEDVKNWNPHTLLIGMQNGAATMESSMKVLQKKLRVELTYDPAIQPCVCYAMLRWSVVSYSLQACGLQPTRLLCPWGFLGNNSGMGCHFIFQQIIPTQGSNLGLPHCRRILHQLSHQGSPILGYLHKKLKSGSWRAASTTTLVVEVFTTAKMWIQLKCLWMDEDE